MLPTILLVVGNVVAILGGIYILLDRFRKWVRELVAEPVSRLEVLLTQHDLAIKRNEREIRRVNARIDKVWST